MHFASPEHVLHNSKKQSVFIKIEKISKNGSDRFAENHAIRIKKIKIWEIKKKVKTDH
jgi:hypothetical protein